MRRVILLTILILSAAFAAQAQTQTPNQINTMAGSGTNPSTATHDFASTPAPRPSGAYGDLPLSFEVNRGQADSRVKYLARGKGYTLFLTPTESVLALRHVELNKKITSGSKQTPGFGNPKNETPQWSENVLRFQLEGASINPQTKELEQLPGISNYYIGNDPSKWRTGIPNYRKVVYRNAYPGIDVSYYGNPGLLESDFVVAPGVDLRAIKLNVQGVDRMRLDERGDLVLETAGGQLLLRKPVAYQLVAGNRQEVEAGYKFSGHTVHFAIGSYDHSQALVIDPTLSYSTYLGGSNGQLGDVASGIGVDASGEAYVVGSTSSTDFPTQSSFQDSLGSGAAKNAFVTKFSANGSTLLFSTYFGGSGTDSGSVLALDAAANAYIVGPTTSGDFPLKNPLAGQGTFAGIECGFVSSFSPAGSLLFSTYLCGGTGDEAVQVKVDSTNHIYVAGNTESANFPTLNPLQATLTGAVNTFITKLAPVTGSGSSLVFSTFFGGNRDDLNQGLALDANDNIYVTGSTNSTTFRTMNPIQANLNAQNGGFNAFVAEINAAGNALVYSTYLGGSSSDRGEGGIAVDSSGNAYVAGIATSPDFPLKNSLQALDDGGDAYIAKIAAGGGSLDFSTFFGGGGESPEVLQLDSANNIYIAGATSAVNFPTRIPLQATISETSGETGFITEFKNDGSDYIFSSYLAGSSSPSFQGDHAFGLALDSHNNLYIAGQTSTLDFPTVSPFQADLKNITSTNGFVLKIAPATPAGPQLFPAVLNFGSVLTNTPSQSQIVTLANGTTALDITSIVLSGPNAADFNSFSTCGQTVPATVVCNFTVTFTPSTTGAESATVTINESSGTQVFNLSGTGATTIPPPPPGTITVAPRSLTFPSQEVSISSTSQLLTVTIGTNPVTLSFGEATGTDPSDFFQGNGGSNACSFGTPLAVGTICQVGVVFDPTAAGARSATFQVFGTFTGSPIGVSVSGTGTAQIANLTPTSFFFQNQVVNTTSGAMIATLKNVSGAGGPSLTNINPSISGSFAISANTCPAGAGLPPGQSCTFSIVFSPTAAGSISGELTVTDNDPAPQSVSLFGTGLNSSATLAPLFRNFLQFGRQTAGTTSGAQGVFLQNIGNTSLTFTNPLSGASPNAFQATNDCSGTIPAASTCDVEVTFTPPAGTGPFFATLTIQSAAAGAPQTVAVSGTGIPASTASLLPNSLVFPVIATGQSSAPQYAYLNNTGTSADTIQSFSINGADPNDFQPTSAPAQSCFFGTILNAQAVCAIGVVFTPIQPGLRTATLQVIDTATGTPQTISLQGGTGVVMPALAITKSHTGNFTQGQQDATYTVTVSNLAGAGITSGTVTVTDTIPSGLTLVSMAGTGWVCTTNTCTRSDALAAGASYPAITVTVNVASNAGASVTNSVAVSGGGSTPANASDPTTILTSASGPSFTSTTLAGGFATVPYGATFSVTGGVPPYSFAVTGGSLPAGFSLTAATGHIFSSLTQVPVVGTSTFAVTVTDSTNASSVGNFTLTIGSAPQNTNNSLLNGQYAFSALGFYDQDTGEGLALATVGSLQFDGAGHVSGEFDSNPQAGASTGIESGTFTGTYSIGPDNRGLMVLTSPQGFGGTFTLAVADVSNGVASTAFIIEFDDQNDGSSRTPETLRLQDPTTFNQTSLAGTYVFGMSGQDLAQKRASELGIISFDNALNVTGGVTDLNDGGTLSNSTSITGSYTAPDTSGRTVLTLNFTSGTVQHVAYIISTNEFVLMPDDPASNNLLLAGSALRQPNPNSFSTTSLAGPDILSVGGTSGNGPTGVIGAIATASAVSGTPTFTIHYDLNDGGNVTLNGVKSGSYTMAANGRAQISGSNSIPLILYLSERDRGFAMTTDSIVRFGQFEPQVGAPFSAGSLAGTYAFGTRELLAAGGGNTLSGVASVSGNRFNLTQDKDKTGGDLLFDQAEANTFTMAANGRVTITNNSDNSSTIGYFITAHKWVVVNVDPTSTNPNLIDVEAITAPLGTPSPTTANASFPTPVAIGTSAQANPIMITNTGQGSLEFTGITNPTDFSGSGTCIATGTSPVIVPPNGTCTIIVTFAPGADTGTQLNETITVQTDGSSNITITATGIAAPEGTVALTVTVTGSGTVISNPPGINCPTTCVASFPSETSITLTATPNSGATFNGWGAGPCEGTSTCTFTITANTSVAATFSASNFSLTVTDAGTGSGTVTSTPSGISCPTTCSANFASGTQVTLTQAAATGSTFAGWSGACTGTAACVVTMSAVESVTATFNSTPVTISVAPGSSSTATTTAGGSVAFGLQLTSLPGVTGTVQLSCSSSSPNITCQIVPSSVTLNGTATNVAIVVNTFCKGSVPGLGPIPGGFNGLLALLLAALSLATGMLIFKRRPQWAFAFAVLIFITLGITACGNLATSPGGQPTPPGSYPLTVTAAAPNGATSSVNLTLKVTQ